MLKTDRITIGITAPVDAGKTTLSEALLYHAGSIRQAACESWAGWIIRTRFWIPTALKNSGASPYFQNRSYSSWAKEA